MAAFGHTESYIPGNLSMDSSESAESDSTFSGPDVVSTHLIKIQFIHNIWAV